MNNKNFNLEEKDIYKLFNHIKLEESEFNDMNGEVDEMQKERIKKNLNKKIKNKNNLKMFKRGSVAAAAALIGIMAIGTVSPALAQNIPVLSSITQTLNDRLGLGGNYVEYSQIINKSITDKGITLTINEVLADDSKLVIGYTVKSDKELKEFHGIGLSRFLKVNGKQNGGHGSSYGENIDAYTYVGNEEFHTNLPKTSDKFNIDLNVDEIIDTKGSWKFAFSVSKEELTKNSKIFKPVNKIDFPDSTVTIDKVVLSPIDTSIFLSGKDKYKKEPNGGSMFDYDYWIAFDDAGVELIPKSLGGGSHDTKTGIFQIEMQYAKSKNIPKYLTIVPCKITPSGGGSVSVDKDGKETYTAIKGKKPVEVSQVMDGVYPKELPQGSMGKIIINDVKNEKDKTIVKFTAVGKAPYFQATELHIKDNKGEFVTPKSYNLHRNGQKPNEFTLELPLLDSSKKYTIYTNDLSNIEFREDLKFKIELNQ